MLSSSVSDSHTLRNAPIQTPNPQTAAPALLSNSVPGSICAVVDPWSESSLFNMKFDQEANARKTMLSMDHGDSETSARQVKRTLTDLLSALG